jgi:hypothetical protein
MSADFDEFTEAGFRNIIRQLKAASYRFATFGYDGSDRHVLWRHDVDFSMHRAVVLGHIEVEEGVIATYFVNPRSPYYSVLDPEVLGLVKKTLDLGHQLGLHFDCDAYGVKGWEFARLESAVSQERRLLESIVGHSIGCVSWHNPDLSNLLDFTQDSIAGLKNAYSDRLRRGYIYCSDSNGYWRFRPMKEVIAEQPPRLHLLTHPEWWTPEPLSPSARIDRAIMGRARRNRALYDEILRAGGRINVTG